MPNQIVIVGFMGCGKTTIARTLASRLGCGFVDLDELVMEMFGRSPAEIIQQEGESAFRETETQVLRQVVSEGAARVVALGGGTWIAPENRKLISEHGGCAVWLDVPFELCWKRIETDAEWRPLAPSRAAARELYERRLPIYKLADARITIEEKDTHEEIATRIIDEISPLGR